MDPIAEAMAWATQRRRGRSSDQVRAMERNRNGLEDVESGGFPEGFHQDDWATFLSALRVGGNIGLACREAGISVKRAKAWLERGRYESTGFYREFLREYRAAAAAGERMLLERIAKAGEDPKRWRANAYLLEAIRPGTYGRGTGGTNVNVVANAGSAAGVVNNVRESEVDASKLTKDRLLHLISSHGAKALPPAPDPLDDPDKEGDDEE